MPHPRLLALDWGTSSLRAYLLGEGGAVLEERQRPWGIMHLPEGGFAGALERIAGDWRKAAPGLGAIACGMVGSAQGLREVPYAECPAGTGVLSSSLVAAEVEPGFTLHIVPGVSTDGDGPDVMRGEETQVMGVLALRPQLIPNVRLVLPGTHSKWVEIQDGRIARFKTYMTGELFAVLSEHSILGRPARAALAGGERPADEAFERGVSAIRGQKEGGVTPLLFSTRALVLRGRLAAQDSLEYLSGLLVGEELRCALNLSGITTPLFLVGDPSLCARYRRAMAVFGADEAPVIEDAASAGLWRIAQSAGLVES